MKKITNTELKPDEVYITCEDVPAYLCADTACSDCPFMGDDISVSNLIYMFMELYNAGN